MPVPYEALRCDDELRISAIPTGEEIVSAPVPKRAPSAIQQQHVE